MEAITSPQLIGAARTNAPRQPKPAYRDRAGPVAGDPPLGHGGTSGRAAWCLVLAATEGAESGSGDPHDQDEDIRVMHDLAEAYVAGQASVPGSAVGAGRVACSRPHDAGITAGESVRAVMGAFAAYVTDDNDRKGRPPVARGPQAGEGVLGIRLVSACWLSWFPTPF